MGTEFAFFVAENGEGYRVPRSAVFQTVNNPGTEARSLQEKESDLMQWAGEHGIPAAEVHELVEVDGVPVLVVEVVEDDGSELDGRHLGQVVARLHQAPLPAGQQERDIADRIAERLNVRHRALAKYGLPELPGRLAEVIRAGTGPVVMNHLDLRRQNVRCRQGRVKALFDWSNALRAPAEVELARVTEYAEIPANGLDLKNVLAGYRDAGGSVRDNTEAWPVLRLDAAIMLANVFDKVAPDEELKTLFLDRCKQLLA
jgi:Ser/Thr protein kinase RdoA (MazF antagonist)